MLLLSLVSSLYADPCGMVPPIATSTGTPGVIQRDGAQRTYVMHSRGTETIALRPGFVGDVEQFGMLIPFPSVPAIRKIDDDTFAHIEAAVDAPELLVEVYDPYIPDRFAVLEMASVDDASFAVEKEEGLGYMEVNVVREEAVGMYQVAVLEAGSPRALDRWMGDNDYAYPEGMDAVVADYVQSKWCFVAVKARVGGNQAATPHPGMREADTGRPQGSGFDGHVQGMGFRFETPTPVVPMRLSVFNGADPRNVVYMLTDEPVRIDGLNTDLVVRQVTGEHVHANLTQPLPMRWINGGPGDVSKETIASFDTLREPEPYNGAARVLFSSDLLAARTGQLSLPFEEAEKELLNISESLGLRDGGMDALYAQELRQERELAVDGALDDVKEMHLTVLDGVFDGRVLARQNLEFSAYTMPADRNVRRNDPLRMAGPTAWAERERRGILDR
jgi:hypothetical protein